VRMESIGGEVRLELRRSDLVRAVNLKSAFELKGNGNDLDLENIEGPVTINTVSGYRGMVRFRNIAKPLHFTGTQTEFQAERIPGEVRMPLGQFYAENVMGPVRVQAQARDVEMSGFTNSLELNVDRGDISLRPGSLPLARMHIRTRAGDVELALPEGAKFDLNATTARGEAVNDFGAPLRQEASNRGASVRGSTGGPAGGPVVNIETTRGRVVVRKASAGDAVPRVLAPLPSIPTLPSATPPQGTPRLPAEAPPAPSPKALRPIEQ